MVLDLLSLLMVPGNTAKIAITVDGRDDLEPFYGILHLLVFWEGKKIHWLNASMTTIWHAITCGTIWTDAGKCHSQRCPEINRQCMPCNGNASSVRPSWARQPEDMH